MAIGSPPVRRDRPRFIEEPPEKLIGATAYDADPLDAELAGMGSR